jgi:hypothetical protein
VRLTISGFNLFRFSSLWLLTRLQTSGGRTSAIVASVQKLKKQQSIGKKKAASAPRKVESSDENIDGDGPSEDDTATKVPAATKNPQRQTPMSRRRNADTPQHDDAHGRSSRRKL